MNISEFNDFHHKSAVKNQFDAQSFNSNFVQDTKYKTRK